MGARSRSAISGRVVKGSTAKRNPKTTVTERTKPRMGKASKGGKKR